MITGVRENLVESDWDREDLTAVLHGRDSGLTWEMVPGSQVITAAAAWFEDDPPLFGKRNGEDDRQQQVL